MLIWVTFHGTFIHFLCSTKQSLKNTVLELLFSYYNVAGVRNKKKKKKTLKLPMLFRAALSFGRPHIKFHKDSSKQLPSNISSTEKHPTALNFAHKTRSKPDIFNDSSSRNFFPGQSPLRDGDCDVLGCIVWRQIEIARGTRDSLSSVAGLLY